MVADFTSQPSDFSGLYTDPSAPKDADPSQQLYQQLATAAGSGQATTTSPTQAAQQTRATQPYTGLAADPNARNTPPADVQAAGPRTSRYATGAAPTAASAGAEAPAPAATQPAANPSSTLNPSADEAALLTRLAPLGIKSLKELKGKSESELRRISTDAVSYEQRQTDLAKHFFKNPDGSWDFTKGPDGRPTGLDASGHVVPIGATTAPGAPAPAPAPAPASKPARTPATKPAAPRAKPRATSRTAPHRPRVTTRPKARPKAAPKPKAAPRPTATRVTQKPAATSRTISRAS